ncbi:MAG: hypothetical protein A3G34_01200 [Candidatus Lindowbacteria bacterium RIFCSPLOWO2_12_FULL_62_27]|nr:MAG: hypothetical protein A3G34_01200 [Candidatus Lindowbacteria bacterium RIFCSPLOWO2_12_FULL_62_27]OGH63688.1 MAG: hypothetical protein A3I06_07650 [Candidatus Lindowbacteria bacterium RIFCSPLOWO2_02_FULL_62_12]
MEGFFRFAVKLKRPVRRTGLALGISMVSFVLMASRPPAETLYTVRILDGDRSVNLLSEPMTLQQRLLESRIWISRLDRVTPPLSTAIRADVTVRIDRDAVRRDQPNLADQPVDEKLIFSRRIPAGKRVKIFSGRGERAARDVVLVGEGKPTPHLKSFLLTATAYSPDIRDCWPYKDGITAIGLKAGYGVAAVDPRVIPLGSRIFVEGYGYAIACDVGGAIRGRKIDLCFDTHEEARAYGRRPVRVHLLD